MTAKIAATALLFATAVWAFEPGYSSYSRLLRTYVCPEGVVYSKIAGNPQLEAVSNEFASVTQDEFSALPTADKIAFLINVYNFQTIALVARHYPLKKGIRGIGKPWDKKFIPLFGGTVSLNHIEHELLRKNYDEPGVHFALNCASLSCPHLLDEPYTGKGLDAQLDHVAKEFLGDATRNRVETGKLMLSQIFQWYGGDFKKKHGSYQAYVMGVLGLEGKHKVKFLPYDWSLNEAPPCRDK